MSMYSDTFAGSGALGNIEVGGVAWQAITGTWTRSGGYASTSDNPAIAVIDTGVGDVDISLSVGAGGDAIYFRVVDANNWLRARTYKEYYSNTSTYWDGTYTTSSWTLNRSYCTYITGNPSGNYYSNNYIYNGQDSGLPTEWDYISNESCTVASDGAPGHMEYQYSRTVSPHMVTSTSSGYTYKVYLEKCVNGTVTNLGTYSSSASALRLVANGSSVQVYVNGTQRIAVTDSTNLTAKKHGIGRAPTNTSATALDNFTLDPFIPPTPTIVAPANNSVVTTGVPTLVGTVSAWGATKCKIRYQIAQDSAFTIGVVTYDEPDTAYRISGNASLTLTEAQYLTQRGWYIRARQIAQGSGLLSNWTNTNAFAVSHAPGVTNLRPSGGNGVVRGASTTLSWQFSDTSSIDSQSAYRVVVERNDTGALVVDTGKVTSADKFYNVALGPEYQNVELRWKVMVWDEEDKASSFTDYAIFIPTDAPVVDILKPADGSNVGTSRPVVGWSFAASGGRTQASYRVTVQQQGSPNILSDSATISGSVSEYTVADPVIENAKTYIITVYVTDSMGITVSDAVTVNAVYEEPAVITFSVDPSYYERLGYVRLTWQQVNDVSFQKWRVYRRTVGVSEWTLLAEISQVSVTEYKDWMVPALETYEYYVVQVVERFGEPVESIVGHSITVTLDTGGYWLLDPVDSSNNTRVHIVTEDGYTTVNEQAEYTIVGRGRHVDEGERVGKSGSMTAKLRSTDGTSARSKKRALEAIRARKSPVYLRNPFGDIDKVALGDLAITRIAGTGSDEFVDVTIPYLEVF